jgi:cytochrome P450
MRQPPSVSMPAPLQVVKWLRSPFEFMEDNAARFGEIFTMRIPALGPVHIISSPEAVKEIFSLGPDLAHAGKANAVLGPFLGRHSLLLLDGSEHIRQRRMILPSFHGERMAAYGRAMLALTEDAIDELPVGVPISAHEVMQEITLGVIVRTVFGITEAARFAELSALLSRALDVLAWPPLLFPPMQRDLGPLSPWGQFVRIRARVREIVLGEISEARSRPGEGRQDVLAMMVAARDEAGGALTDDELFDELVTLLVAGHETTATSLAWALRWLLVERWCPSGSPGWSSSTGACERPFGCSQ